MYAATTLDATRLRALLAEVAAGRLPVEEAERRLARLPFEDLGYARVDHHRAVRGLGPEVIYARGKTPEQVAGIATAILAQGRRSGAGDQGRPGPRRGGAGRAARRPSGIRARACWCSAAHPPGASQAGSGSSAAGTSDLPVADEAARDRRGVRLRGRPRWRTWASPALHRLFAEVERLQRADVLVVVAGMEGALPSLVGGLVGVPVLAVPTSVGYGAAFDGLAPLLAMLNSCAVGVGVVNIDNGFGAGALAVRILAAARRVERPAVG